MAIVPEPIARVGPPLHPKKAAVPRSAPSAGSPTETVLAKARALAKSETIHVVVALEEPAVSSDGVLADALRIHRTSAVAPSQEAFGHALAALGGRVARRFSLTNQVAVDVPAARIDELLRIPSVVSLHPTDAEIRAEAAADGNYLRAMDAVRIEYFHSVGATGAFGGRASGPAVRIAQIEPFPGGVPLPSHYLYKDAQTGLSRITDHGSCTPAYGCLGFSSYANVGNHSQRVASILIGNIAYGQDPGVPAYADQTARSGVATDATLMFLGAGGAEDMVVAIEYAVYNGADIVNMSMGLFEPIEWRVPPNPCGYGTMGTFDPAGLSATIRAATNAGVLFVKSAGNRSPNTSVCTVSFPAWLPQVVTVGALETGAAGDPPAYNVTHLRNSEIVGSSSGGINYWVSNSGGGSSLHSNSVVGLVAPGERSLLGEAAPSGYSTPATEGLNGTSMAAPVVAGAAALLRNMYWQQGWAGSLSPTTLVPLLLLMGDSWDASTDTDRSTGFSRLSGAGRIRMHYFGGLGPYGPSDMTGAWYLSTAAFALSQGAESCIAVGPAGGQQALPSTINELKVVLAWDEPGGWSASQPAADIDLSVWNACPSGTIVPRSSWGHIWTDGGYDQREKIRLLGSQVAGRCIRACAYGYAATAARFATIMAYAHSDNPTVH